MVSNLVIQRLHFLKKLEKLKIIRIKIGFHSVFTNSVLLQTYTCVPVFCTLNTGQDPDEIKYR